MKKIKLRRKETQLEMSDYENGIEHFKRFIQMNGTEIEKMSDNSRERFLFMGGFYAGCKYKEK